MIFIEKPLGVPGERMLGLRTGEIHFATSEPPRQAGCDVVRYNQCGFPLPGAREYRTLHIRLDQAAEDIQAGFQEVTRYEIRRCGRGDGPSPRMIWRPEASQMEEFLAFFAGFLADKDLPGQHAMLSFYRATLECYRRSSALVLSMINSGAGLPIAWHSYLVDGERARLVNSASRFRHADNQERNLVSRCNRYLHWHDMQEFRARGYRIYDFGGLSSGGDSISGFKESFGGTPVLEYYDHRRCFTLRGSLALAIQHLANMTLALRLGRPPCPDASGLRR